MRSMATEDFMKACGAFLTPDQLVPASAAQEKYGSNTTNSHAAIAGALLPTTQEEVVAIVNLANEHKIGLYPISTGHNWGYGGATPHSDDSVIVDLHRMRRIITVDRELGIAIVEPGVTTGQLYDYLEANQLDYLVPVTGAGPTNSLIGNALERGFGIVPTSDHFQAVLSITAVLADGSVYCSALAANKNSDIGHLYKWGVGPYLDGLFSQGNFGIVTQATIALQPKPESTMLFALELNGPHPKEAVCFVREMNKRYGKNLSNLSIMNKNRLLSTSPYENPDCIPDWKIVGAIYGDKHVVRAVKRGIKHYHSPSLVRRKFASAKLLLAVKKYLQQLPKAMKQGRCYDHLTHTIELGELLLGKPTDAAVQQVAYGGKGVRPLDPDRDNLGLLWYAPLIPQRVASVDQFLDMAGNILKEYAFDFSITLVGFSWHCFDGTLLLKYDRSDPADCQRAKNCYEALFKAGKERGFVPYRVGLQGMKLLVDEQVPFWQAARAVKNALDPNGIFSAGRYSLA